MGGVPAKNLWGWLNCCQTYKLQDDNLSFENSFEESPSDCVISCLHVHADSSEIMKNLNSDTAGNENMTYTSIAHTLRHLRLRLMLGVCRWFRCKRWTIQHSYQRPQLSSHAQRRDKKAGMEYWLQEDTVLVTKLSYMPRNLWICGENLIEDLTPTVSQAPRYALHSHVSRQCPGTGAVPA